MYIKLDTLATMSFLRVLLNTQTLLQLYHFSPALGQLMLLLQQSSILERQHNLTTSVYQDAITATEVWPFGV